MHEIKSGSSSWSHSRNWLEQTLLAEQTWIEHVHRLARAVPLESVVLCSYFHFCRRNTHLSAICPQVPSPNGQLVNSAPLEQTPAEEESRKSISRSFKGTMASSTERKGPPPSRLISFFFYVLVFHEQRVNFMSGLLSSVRGRPDPHSCCWISREGAQRLPGNHACR